MCKCLMGVTTCVSAQRQDELPDTTMTMGSSGLWCPPAPRVLAGGSHRCWHPRVQPPGAESCVCAPGAAHPGWGTGLPQLCPNPRWPPPLRACPKLKWRRPLPSGPGRAGRGVPRLRGARGACRARRDAADRGPGPPPAMGGVKAIGNDAEFQPELSAAGSRLAVVKFTMRG